MVMVSYEACHGDWCRVLGQRQLNEHLSSISVGTELGIPQHSAV